MKPLKIIPLAIMGLMLICLAGFLLVGKEKDAAKPFIWPSQPPPNCPFEPSKEINGIEFTGRHSDYHVADTWYPSWAEDNRLYSPFTDGQVEGFFSNSNGYDRGKKRQATTGQAVLIGNDPLHLTSKCLGLFSGDPYPYNGRYPCGSLVHNGVWYYGTYCLAPEGATLQDSITYNWPWLGPFVGFRCSTDYGKTWTDTLHTTAKPLFGETGMNGHPVKIGSPHFVDFGKNMEHSPDGKAYLVCHGAVDSDPQPRFANLSWISGDQIYLIRITPTIENINDMSKYEYFAGRDSQDQPLWTGDFSRIQPLIDWNNNCGCATMTYDAPLKKYLLCITDGWPTYARMSTYILEATEITGPWKLVTYLKDFGQQAYFVNLPTKFIAANGRSAWLCYSANFVTDWNGMDIKENPPGSHYGLVLQEIRLLGPGENQ